MITPFIRQDQLKRDDQEPEECRRSNAFRDLTDDWEQLRLFVFWPAQKSYELLRPIVLFGRSPAERARETGVPEHTLRRQADRFDAISMASLLVAPAPPTIDRRALPAEIRQAILELKAECPPLSAHEIAGICQQRFRRPVANHTVTRVLAAGPVSTGRPRRFPRYRDRYRDIADPVERRLAVMHLYLEGWTITSIAGYLAMPRPNVYTEWHAALRLDRPGKAKRRLWPPANSPCSTPAVWQRASHRWGGKWRWECECLACA